MTQVAIPVVGVYEPGGIPLMVHFPGTENGDNPELANILLGFRLIHDIDTNSVIGSSAE
jgi:hypothetical protein